MFCNEPIQNVYFGRLTVDDDYESRSCWLDCYHDLALYAVAGTRIVFETEHFYISVGENGARAEEKSIPIETLERSDEWFSCAVNDMGEDELPWVEVEYTIFTGERLLEVEETEYGFLLTFDDLCLKVIPCPADGTEPTIHNNPVINHKSSSSFLPIRGCERHIRRICDCGGQGELFQDFVEDYIVRCNRCKRSTWAGMNAIDAIEDWNAGELHWDASDILIE